MLRFGRINHIGGYDFNKIIRIDQHNKHMIVTYYNTQSENIMKATYPFDISDLNINHTDTMRSNNSTR